MSKEVCLTLLTSTGTELFAGLVPVGSCAPASYTVTIGSTAVAAGDVTASVTALPVAIPKGNRLAFASVVTITTSSAATLGAVTLAVTALGAAVPAGTTLKFGTVTVITSADASLGATSLAINPAPAAISSGATASFRPNPVVLVLAADAPAAATSVAIEPAPGAVATDLTAITYALLPILGGENSPFQGQMQTNSVTLLNSGGWVSKSQAQGDYNMQWTGYIPLATSAAAGYRLIKNAWYNKRYLYIERFLSNGDMTAGTVIVTNFSEQVQQAQYVQYQCTFDGHEAPIYSYGS